MPDYGGGGGYGLGEGVAGPGVGAPGGGVFGGGRGSESNTSEAIARAVAAKAGKEAAAAEAQRQKGIMDLENQKRAHAKQTEDLSFFEEVEQRGWPTTLANHLMGMIPGVDVKAQTYSNMPGSRAPSVTSMGAGRLAGDLMGMGLGIPGIGDLAQAGLDKMSSEEGFGTTDISDLAGALSATGPGGGATAEPGNGFAPRTIDQTVAAAEQEEQEALAEALFGPGYTRAGQGVIYT